MKPTIIPKSDQLNADDLLSGPITIKITDVKIKAGQEQPVSIYYEGDNGKPYKACKSMCRVMVTAWGSDAAKYIGHSLTLFCDPKVKWAGLEVGGIRISHMSDIDDSMTMALTVTRANKKPFTVKPLVIGAPKAAAGEIPQSGLLPGSPPTAPNAAATLSQETKPVESGEGAQPNVPAPAAAPSRVIDQAIELEDRAKAMKINSTAFLTLFKVKTFEQLAKENYAGAKEWLDKKQQ